MISSQTRNMVRDFQDPRRTLFQKLNTTVGQNTRSKSKAASAAISEGPIGCYGRPSQYTVLAALKNLIRQCLQNAEICYMSHSFKSPFLSVAVELRKSKRLALLQWVSGSLAPQAIHLPHVQENLAL